MHIRFFKSIWILSLLVPTLVGCATVGPQTDRPLPADHPRIYTADHVTQPPQIDGRIDDAAWNSAAWTAAFIDIEGNAKARPRFETRAKMCWDDEYFYVAAEMEEPHLWGTLTDRDAIIYHDNDFEIFIDPDGDRCRYNEYEINVLGTEMDLRMSSPYRCGGNYDLTWDFEGVRSAVGVQGTINDPSDQDEQWVVEVAIPWSSMADTAGVACPPRARDTWWVNFSRVQWQADIRQDKYHKIKDLREDNWVWSPQGAIDMHRPEYWGLVHFVATSHGVEGFQVPADTEARAQMRRLIDAVEQYHATHESSPTALSELQLTHPLDQALPTPVITAIHGRTVIVQSYTTSGGDRKLVYDEDGCLQDMSTR
ncbi:MAG: carbohydrate-binding family 9-like protein [Phycisphaerales bacterium]|nr:carbohydrate-binding family 9-like protein [Phycisphaerales bacterium]